jgi:hypothetical protein
VAPAEDASSALLERAPMEQMFVSRPNCDSMAGAGDQSYNDEI